MKRDLLLFKRKNVVNGCCPGHDTWPDQTYRSNLSKKARSKDIAREHRYARRKLNLDVKNTATSVSDVT